MQNFLTAFKSRAIKANGLSSRCFRALSRRTASSIERVTCEVVTAQTFHRENRALAQ